MRTPKGSARGASPPRTPPHPSAWCAQAGRGGGGPALPTALPPTARPAPGGARTGRGGDRASVATTDPTPHPRPAAPVAARTRYGGEQPRVLVAFSGDDSAASTLPSELRARGAE
eukprot:3430117-Pleurochrysis_carterae.AAC.1